jgi:hypothetical protein
MAAVITSLYRAYCYARLLEMRGRRRHAGPGKGSSGDSTLSSPEEAACDSQLKRENRASYLRPRESSIS